MNSKAAMVLLALACVGIGMAIRPLFPKQAKGETNIYDVLEAQARGIYGTEAASGVTSQVTIAATTTGRTGKAAAYIVWDDRLYYCEGTNCREIPFPPRSRSKYP